MDVSSSQPFSDSASYHPISHIPERRSSRLFRPRANSPTSAPSSSVRNAPTPLPPPHKTPAPHDVVTPRGSSASPIRRSSIHGPFSRTFVPQVVPTDILDAPRLTHPRLLLDLHLTAPVFMGGATVEGDIGLVFDPGSSEGRRKSLAKLSVTRVSVSLLGLERCRDRQEIFRAYVTNVVHASDPAVHTTSILPFRLDLPVLMGPPPYRAKKVGIVYLLSCLVQVQIADKTHFVRHTREIMVLTVHDRMCCIYDSMLKHV